MDVPTNTVDNMFYFSEDRDRADVAFIVYMALADK